VLVPAREHIADNYKITQLAKKIKSYNTKITISRVNALGNQQPAKNLIVAKLKMTLDYSEVI
jgi:hypothetical protein